MLAIEGQISFRWMKERSEPDRFGSVIHYFGTADACVGIHEGERGDGIDIAPNE